MRTWVAAGVALAVAAPLLVVWMNRARPTEEATERSLPLLEATRLTPRPEAGEEVEVDPFASVEFVYSVHNSGSEAIRGLKLRQGCRCEPAEDLPEEIAPGETARVGFRLRAPDLGTARRRVDLIAQDPPSVVLSLDVALRVKFIPPTLARRPEGTRVAFLEGDDSPRELSFEAIEKRQSKPWITELTFEPGDLLRVAAAHVDELTQVDPELTRRVYRFELSAPSFGVGCRRGFYRVHTRCDPQPMQGPLPLEVEVLDRVAIIPNPVSLAPGAGAASEPARIVVVRRAGGGPIELAHWERQLLDVRRVETDGARRAVFAVVAKAIPSARRETRIVFDVGGRETREVPVHLLPVGSPPTPP